MVAIIHGDDDDDDPKHFADVIEFPLQWRRFFRSFFQHPGDSPQFGLHAGCQNHRFSASVSRRGAAKDHIAAVAQSDLFGDRRGVLGNPAGSPR